MDIAEIKQRTKTGITEYMHDAEKAEIHRQDAAFLLQELDKIQQENERYKETLRKIEEQSVVWEELCRDTLKS